MKMITTNQVLSLIRKPFLGMLLLCSMAFCSNKSLACTASFTYSAGVNGHYSFTSTSVGFSGYVRYFWNPGDGSGWHNGSTSFSYIYQLNGRFPVRLFVTDSTCSDSSAVDTVVVSNVATPCNLSASFTYTVSPHGVVNFTSTSTGTNANTQYYWTPGDSNIYHHGTTTYTHKYLYQGWYGVWLTIKDTGKSYCIDSAYAYFYVGSADSSHCHIHADFTYTVGANGQVTFKDSSSGAPLGATYLWLVNNSYLNGGKGPFTHTFVNNGTYSITLFVSDSTCADSITIPIAISNACNLAASFTSSVGAHGQTKFTSTSVGANGATTYTWKFGDGSPNVTGAGPHYDTVTHKYIYKGGYYVWLILKDTGVTHCSDSVENYVYVSTADSSYCHIHADFGYTTGLNGQVTFYDSTTGAPVGSQYNWYNSNTWFHSGQGSFTYTFPTDSTYHISLVVSDSSCSDSISIPVTVTNACNMRANFTWAYDSSGQIQFISTSTGVNGSTKYLWSFGDGSPYYYGVGASYDTVTHAYSFLGYYNVTLFDSGGGCASSITKRVYIYNKDSLQACFTYMTDTLNAYQIDFNAACSKGTDNYTYYKWTPGDTTAADSGLNMTTYTHVYRYMGPHSASLSIWYTVLPHKPRLHSTPEYDLSTYTQTVYVGSATGVASVADAKNYTVYPNPSNGTFNIGVSGIANGQNAEIRISNMIGQVVYDTHTALSGNTIPVTMGAASNGIYLLQVITAANTYNSKIIVQK